MMGTVHADAVVVMSIKPRWADAIMSGRKRVEFRRARFGRAVTHVIVYATSPVQRVLGYFEVAGISEDDPGTLWDRHAADGEIGHQAFRDYYEGASRGVAIHVGRVRQLEDPVPLRDVVPNAVPPQSFVYARSDTISVLESLAATAAGEAGGKE